MTAVRFDNVSKRFGALAVLDEVSFEIAKGTAFCLLGRSGTGKSVTLRHIVGLVEPDSGAVFVEERDINGLSRRELGDVRTHMGFLFQNAALFDSMSVGDNVAFPMRRHTKLSDGDVDGESTRLRKDPDIGIDRVHRNRRRSSRPGRVAAQHLTVLSDPRHAIPHYDAILLVGPTHARDAKFTYTLTSLVGRVSVEAMREANYRVDRDTDKDSPEAAARWLEKRVGL